MNHGFSLIELLIVLAIIGMLACFSYPSYHAYIIRMHRLDGQTALLNLANRMEHFFANNNSYQTATIATNPITDVLTNRVSEGGYYTLSISNATFSTFSLQATPKNAQATNDTDCQSLTFNSQGIKGITQGPQGVPTSNATLCWS